jgi:alpha-D-ribose 1-methylphosphonate 5-triphosphate synthase subunit PhnI
MTDSTNVVPFPLVKRRDFVFRQAQTINQYVRQGDADIAELYLTQQLKRQRKKLERRGISESDIERELAALRRAIVLTSRVEDIAL